MTKNWQVSKTTRSVVITFLLQVSKKKTGTSVMGTELKTHSWETIITGCYLKVYENNVQPATLDHFNKYYI